MRGGGADCGQLSALSAVVTDRGARGLGEASTDGSGETRSKESLLGELDNLLAAPLRDTMGLEPLMPTTLAASLLLSKEFLMLLFAPLGESGR